MNKRLIMQRMLLILVCLIIAAPGTLLSRYEPESYEYPDELDYPAEPPIRDGDSVRFGFRIHHQILRDSKRTPADLNGNGRIEAEELLDVSYLGSIVVLDIEQSFMPPRPYLQWQTADNWGLELSWERLRTRTWTFWDGHTDGAFDMKGPLISVFLDYPTGSRITPSIGIGGGFLFSEFDHSEAWRYVAGIVQTIETSDEFASFVYIDCDVKLTDQWILNFYARYMKANLNAHYYISWPSGEVFDDRGVTVFPMDNITFAIGMAYAF